MPASITKKTLQEEVFVEFNANADFSPGTRLPETQCPAGVFSTVLLPINDYLIQYEEDG
ncbi:MAG: hypothetical protein ABSF13_07705 [Smithella sp.]